MIRTNVVIATVMGALLAAGLIQAQVNVQQIVAQKVQPILPKGGGGGVAIAVQMNGKTQFFNYGMADNAQNRPVTPDSILISAPSVRCSRRHCLHKPSSKAS